MARRIFCVFVADDVGNHGGALDVYLCERLLRVQTDHGRLETRRVAFVVDVFWMDKPMREDWKKLAAISTIESEQEIKGKVSVERHYFIASDGIKTVEQFAHSAFRNDELHSDRSLRRRRKFADRRPDYCVALLGLRPHT